MCTYVTSQLKKSPGSLNISANFKSNLNGLKELSRQFEFG